LQNRFPFFDGHLADGVIAGNAGVIDEVIDPSVLFDYSGDDAPAVVEQADVALIKMEPRSAPVEMYAKFLGTIPVRRESKDGDGCPVFGEKAADRASNSAGAARYDGHAVFKR